MANLLANAIDAYADSPLKDYEKVVTVTLRQEPTWLELRVSDRGKGIAAAQLPQVFEPFYTTKADKGTGIGLTRVKRIVEDDFHGSITLASSPGSDSSFTIQLKRRP